MKPSSLNTFKVLAGTFMSLMAGFVVVGSKIFDPSTQFFHFILAGFLISLMWIPLRRLYKAGVVIVIFLLYKGFLAPPFLDFFWRDVFYFLIFFLLSFVSPTVIQNWKISRPVSRFIFGGVVTGIGYILAALAIFLVYRTYHWEIGSMIKANLIYGLTIGLAVQLGFEIINVIEMYVNDRKAD
ncbi:MAG: hypothetical protein PHE86_00235 [Candidatus Marinimicrobia bacterium]|nr:hypothetical protein [Candidatus Neomarinimicrobiota bacterium]MDD5583133.1 hypothetical protein [Candidatus Neomarinimicrobiota bacterium]